MKISWRRCVFLGICFLPVWLILSAFCQQADSGQSLGDVARKLRKDTTNEVKMTDADTKKLFASVDRIFAFAAEDTGMPKHAAVKRRLVSKADLENDTTRQLAREEFAKSFAQEELSMKKMGFLPRDFNLKEFLVKSTGQEIAAYYDDETKTISMLNWVPFDQQEPILAHELTHALQDQSFGMEKWMKAAETEGDKKNDPMPSDIDTDEESEAREAVVGIMERVTVADLCERARRLQQNPPEAGDYVI